MKRMLTMVAALFLATTSAASAATYKVDGLINDSYDGFRSSLIHSQRYKGDMSGYPVAHFDERVRDGGTWDTETGKIRFRGSLHQGMIRYRARGYINENGGGHLRFLFRMGRERMRLVFKFDGDLNMGPANSFDGEVISLWGDTGKCSKRRYMQCFGTDLRIGVSEVPSEVPLPASALLLLGGVGAFAGLRRKKG